MEKGETKALVVAIGGRILGVLTTDDIERARAAGLDLTRARVSEAMSPAFVVASDERLRPVAHRMSAEGIGFVIVVDREDGGVSGLFALADVHGLGVAASMNPPPPAP
jgi:CBS domain-containing protein